MSDHHQEGLAHLVYGIKQGGGFIALTGEVGTGKTTLCHCLLEQLPENIDIALVLNPKINSIELLATVCDELQIAYDDNKQTLKGLIDNLNQYLLAAHASGRRTVLMIDEAQNLSLDALEQVRLLTNLETSKNKLLQIILVGQPELKQQLEQPALRQLNQRITARYHLTPLSFIETQKYIQHRLAVCGGKTDIFSHKAIKKVYKLTKGIPRLINILCDRALLGAYVTNTQTVTAKIIKDAAKEVFNVEKSSNNTILKNTVIALGLFIFLMINMYILAPDKPTRRHIVLSGTFPQTVVENNIKKKSNDSHNIKDGSMLKPLNFESAMMQQKVSINEAITSLAGIWGKKLTDVSECKEVEETGLKCLFDKSSWKELIALNRPVIMEFSNVESEKFYAVLVGLNQGNPVFQFNQDRGFPVGQILSLWEGYFLMFWQPPINTIEYVYPAQKSKAVLWIRKQMGLNHLGLKKSSFFDNNLKSEIQKFQRKHHLTIDGIVGPRTFIHLNNNDSQIHSPKLKLDY